MQGGVGGRAMTGNGMGARKGGRGLTRRGGNRGDAGAELGLGLEIGGRLRQNQGQCVLFWGRARPPLPVPPHRQKPADGDPDVGRVGPAFVPSGYICPGFAIAGAGGGAGGAKIRAEGEALVEGWLVWRG